MLIGGIIGSEAARHRMDILGLLLRILPYYLLTVTIETPVLVLGLSRRHSLKRRIFAGFWLTACTYPFVTVVFPYFLDPAHARLIYVAVSETFAPVAECLLFWLAFGTREELGRRSMWRDFLAITLANLLSFTTGELLKLARLI